jgi:PPP family 3-phenylpropionic acid transporter
MRRESQIPIIATEKRRFAVRLALFYSAVFAVTGAHLPFFSVWLKAIGIGPGWIGIIMALPAVTRFTTLPYATALAEKRHAIRAGIMISVFATVAGFAVLGLQREPLALLLVYAVTCVLWTPTVPLTDAYALRGVAHYGLDYGPVRLWGSAAFAAGTLLCGFLVDTIPGSDLIWVIVAFTVLTALASLLLQPLHDIRRKTADAGSATVLLRDPGFWAIIVSAALIQDSHVAYYTFSAITWQAHGLGGLTIGGLWTLGVMAEIIVFALSPRFSLQASSLMAIGGATAVLRWLVTACDPPLALLAIVQLGHGLTFGFTIVGTMNLLVQRVPAHQIARGQGYYAAVLGVLGVATSVSAGAIYARIGEGVYFVMAAMAGLGALLIWTARHRAAAHPQSEASGG